MVRKQMPYLEYSFNSKRDFVIKYCLAMSISCVILSALILIFTSFSFSINQVIGKWQFVASLAFAILISYFFIRSSCRRKVPQRFIAVSVGLLVILILSTILMGKIYDLSYDGQAYHQETIIQLVSGWNPFYRLLPSKMIHSIWINHYSRASEVLAASLYKLTGNIECGKAFNLIFLCTSFFLSLSLLLCFERVKTWLAVVTSIIIALNPVVLYQVLTYYVDGMMASLLTSLILCSILLFIRFNNWLCVLLLGLIITIVNIKFTALVYAVILTTGLIIPFILSKKWGELKFITTSILIGFMVGILFVGFNPYITNTINNGNPFYPLMGKDKVDIITSQLPPGFSHLNSYERLFYSLYGVYETPNTVAIKIPFSIGHGETWSYLNPGPKVGGFGPLFSGAFSLFLIISMGMIFVFYKKEKSGKLVFPFYICVVILFSCLINPEVWWARYAPQFWLIPVLILPVLGCVSGRISKVCMFILVLAFLYNINLVADKAIGINMNISKSLYEQLEDISKQHRKVNVYFGAFKSNRVRFQKMGIKYREVDHENEIAHASNIIEIIQSTAKVEIPKH